MLVGGSGAGRRGLTVRALLHREPWLRLGLGVVGELNDELQLLERATGVHLAPVCL